MIKNFIIIQTVTLYKRFIVLIFYKDTYFHNRQLYIILHKRNTDLIVQLQNAFEEITFHLYMQKSRDFSKS